MARYLSGPIFYKNPSLALLGNKLYKCELQTVGSVILISRVSLAKDQSVFPLQLSDNIYFVKTWNEKNSFADGQHPVNAVLYFVFEQDGHQVIRRANIKAEAQAELCDRFLDFITIKFVNNEKRSLVNVSEADERRNVVFHYDLDERPQN